MQIQIGMLYFSTFEIIAAQGCRCLLPYDGMLRHRLLLSTGIHYNYIVFSSHEPSVCVHIQIKQRQVMGNFVARHLALCCHIMLIFVSIKK